MVLEILMYFKGTPNGILVPFPYLISFHITLCYFSHSIYRGGCAEQNALGLRRRSPIVLEISMYFEKTTIGFCYHFPISFSFHITLCYFSHSIYRGECAEQNAFRLRRRSLMVLEISMYFEKTTIGILVPFPYLIFFSHHTLLFFALDL